MTKESDLVKTVMEQLGTTSPEVAAAYIVKNMTDEQLREMTKACLEDSEFLRHFWSNNLK